MTRAHLPALLGTVALGALSYRAGLSLPALETSPAPQDELTELLDTIEFLGLPDGTGQDVRTLRFSGVNLQIVSGQGATNGNPAAPNSTDPADVATNGRGNLILGYHEPPAASPVDRTGSHNVVVGTQHGYTSFGGLVAGRGNALAAPYAAVVAGRGNTASGDYALVAGGRQNTASGDFALAAGGRGNAASAEYSTALGGGSASGGEGNVASGPGSVVLGGRGGAAEGPQSVVAGGVNNTASGEAAVAVGGEDNVAQGVAAGVFGGLGRTAGTQHEVLADGAGDGSWTLTEANGTTTLSADADRVGIGVTTSDAKLEVRPDAGDALAASFHGDLAVGSGAVTGTSEHVRFRAGKDDWFAGVVNAGDKESDFFISTSETETELFHMTTAGDLGLGTDDPQGSLHVRRDGRATIAVEGGDPSKGEDVGLEVIQGPISGRFGFFGGSGNLVFERTPEPPRPEIGVHLTVDGRVQARGILEATGTTIVQKDLTVAGIVGIGEDLVVGEDLTVMGDLVIEGDLVLEGASVPAPWARLVPIAWGRVDGAGDRISGSTNWSSEEVQNGLLLEVRVTLDEDPGPTLLMADVNDLEAWGTRHPDDPNSNLPGNVFAVVRQNPVDFSFVLLEMRD